MGSLGKKCPRGGKSGRVVRTRTWRPRARLRRPWCRRDEVPPLSERFPLSVRRDEGFEGSPGPCSFASGRDGRHLRESRDCRAGPSGGPWGGGPVQVKAWHVLHPTESSVAHGVVSRGGRLQLSRLQPAQAGTYTCVAENAQAEARKDFVVAVLGTSVPCTLPCALPPCQALPLPGLTTAPRCSGPPDPELGHHAGAQRPGGAGGAAGLRG